MSFLDIMLETFRSLRMNKVRSALTILGIVVGIASVIILVSVGQGTKASITDEISSLGSNLLSVSSSTDGYEITEDDVTAIENLALVEAVAPQSQGTFDVVVGETSLSLSVAGVTEDYATVNSVDIANGSFVSDYENEKELHVVVLGSDAATELFDTADPVGETITIDGTVYVVIGVAESQGGTTASNADTMIYIPLSTAQSSLTGDSLTSLTLTVTDEDNIELAESFIEETLAQNHGLDLTDDTESTIYTISSQTEVLDAVSDVADTLTMFLAAIAGISLVVGGIGVMNMMLTSVTERIREIGLRKAIGATPSAITAQFLAEAIVLTVAGGLLGVLVGCGGSAAVEQFASVSTDVTLSSVMLSVGVCAVIGIVFGFYPARRAAKLDPIRALRYQ